MQRATNWLWDSPAILGSLIGGGLALTIIVPLFWLMHTTSAQIAEREEAARAAWSGAELVRICGRGEEIYRLNGRLVTGARDWSMPRSFAADVTPEAACSR